MARGRRTPGARTRLVTSGRSRFSKGHHDQQSAVAVVGTVAEISGEIEPWDVDSENPDRPERPGLTPWVSFDVEGWYTNDWGSTFNVWMPRHAVEVGQRLAVAGDARHGRR